ncbi:hypothetical protein [Candidatus Mycobacterium methanotrophicum]|uniref:Uncharacterized protein n=2 Tax=Candidatus Mycobacterium methanotrophicum TaxID=2943498 RepID=A0ABY4QPS8_9MYCO|nr:hypothetical protein [Candidatus Mycobacterium methanotrophicum]UQX11784.1 hypothetical protein M5I08_04980 [Candidatus Mycobacterium methanotrophicum]
MTELRDKAPDLADQVVEGELTVKDAFKKWRDRESLRERQARQAAETATSNLCSHIPVLAAWCGDVITRYARDYNPGDAYSRRIDKKMLTDARTAIDDIIRVREERGLPRARRAGLGTRVAAGGESGSDLSDPGRTV